MKKFLIVISIFLIILGSFGCGNSGPTKEETEIFVEEFFQGHPTKGEVKVFLKKNGFGEIYELNSQVVGYSRGLGGPLVSRTLIVSFSFSGDRVQDYLVEEGLVGP